MRMQIRTWCFIDLLSHLPRRTHICVCTKLPLCLSTYCQPVNLRRGPIRAHVASVHVHLEYLYMQSRYGTSRRAPQGSAPRTQSMLVSTTDQICSARFSARDIRQGLADDAQQQSDTPICNARKIYESLYKMLFIIALNLIVIITTA